MNYENAKVLIVVPCYNCAPQIPRSLRALRELPADVFSTILVVDNHSVDNTIEEARATIATFTKQDQCRFQVLTNSENLGLGGTFRSKFEFARESGFEYFIFFHGDDQALAADVPLLLASAKENPELAAVLGARFHPNSRRYGYQLSRTIGNLILNLVYSLVCGKRIYDLGSGLTLYRPEKIASEKISALSSHIAFDAELLLTLLRDRIPFSFMPITWREQDQKSNVRNLATGILLLRILFFREKVSQ